MSDLTDLQAARVARKQTLTPEQVVRARDGDEAMADLKAYSQRAKERDDD